MKKKVKKSVKKGKRGRPKRKGGPGTRTSVSLSKGMLKACMKQARKEKISVSKLAVKGMRMYLDMCGVEPWTYEKELTES